MAANSTYYGGQSGQGKYLPGGGGQPYDKMSYGGSPSYGSQSSGMPSGSNSSMLGPQTPYKPPSNPHSAYGNTQPEMGRPTQGFSYKGMLPSGGYGGPVGGMTYSNQQPMQAPSMMGNSG